MNRLQNLAALQQLTATLESGAPDRASEIRLRQAAYLHTIIAAVLNDQVAGLPETAPIIR